MTDRATFLTLAARCEKATGPDRALHWAIHAAKLGNPRPTIDELHGAPDYTTSLDAAMTLAGDNEAFWLLHEAVERLRIHLLPADPYPTNEAQRGYLARYFTAAALRAQAAMVGEPS